MYKIYADDTLIYDSTIEDYKIGKGVITLEVNKSGSFVFSVYPDHFFYDSFVKLKTVITVYKSDKIVFRGRILNDVTDYYNNKNITCEGELGFLQDSIIRPFSYTDFPDELLTRFIDEHNSQVDDFKRFKIGEVTVVDANGRINRSNGDYSESLNVLNSALIESALGGYFYITHGEDGRDPIPTLNYLADFKNVSSQIIEFGSNLKDYSKTVKAENMATAIIPLGASDEDGYKLTIESFNDGLDYVYSKTGTELYGWIFKTVVWDDITNAKDLKEKAEAYLDSIINQNITIELNAIDLHLLDRSIESFKVCEYVHVKSEPHNLDAVLLCNKQTMDLLKPENDTVVLGYQSPTFTKNSSDVAASVSTIKQINSSLMVTIKETAKSLESEITDCNDSISLVSQKLDNISLEVSNGETSSIIKLMSGGVEIASQEISMSGVVTFSGLYDGTTVIHGGCIQTGTISADRLNLKGAISFNDFTDSTKDLVYEVLDVAKEARGYASDAQEQADSAYANANNAVVIASQIVNGTYSGGTFIDGKSIYSPEIYANEFNVLPESLSEEGSFNLYGYYASNLYHFLKIGYYESTAPRIKISSPGGAVVDWDFNRTYFSGYMDLTRAKIIQPYFLIKDITSSSVSVEVYNIRSDDKITFTARPLNDVTTVERTQTATDTTTRGNFTDIPANTDVVVGVKVNDNCIGYQTVRTKTA